MADTYKVYLLEQGGHVVAVQFVTADNDEAALEAARALKGSKVRDVWQGERHVGALDLSPTDEPSSASLWL